jgi:hypothetical protein
MLVAPQSNRLNARDRDDLDVANGGPTPPDAAGDLDPLAVRRQKGHDVERNTLSDSQGKLCVINRHGRASSSTRPHGT